MESQIPPTISSFIIRFVVEPGCDSYRGEIQHIQTDEKSQFVAWVDAVEFIKRFVPIENQK